jgi:hypothetical protein
MIAGAALSLGGGLLLGLGISSNGCGCLNSSDASGLGLFGPGAGVILLGVGGGHLVAGVVLWGVGGQPPRRSVSKWALPSVGAGPRAVSLTWRF